MSCDDREPPAKSRVEVLGKATSTEEEKIPPPPRLPGATIRIVTRAPKGMRARGQETQVLVVHPDGLEEPLNNVASVRWWVDSRTDYTRAILVLHGVHADVEGTLGDELAQARASEAHWREEARKATQLAQELQERLEKARHSIPGE